MKQQINLYQPMFRRQEKVFSAMTMIQTICLFVGVLTVIYFYGQYQINPLEAQLARMNRDIANLRGQVTQYQREVPAQSQSQLMQAEIARLERELADRQRIMQLLEEQRIITPVRFSGIMEALARQHLQGTWLTGIGIGNGGKTLSLDGRTLSSTLVPQYVQRLAEEAAMSEIAFNVLELRRPDPELASRGVGEMTFRISSN